MLDDTQMFHQQQLEQQEWELLQHRNLVQQLNSKLSAMSDEEFFALLESVDKEKVNVSA